ncbi:hypothetical protein BE17_37160 [Sorangium cellulosum]|uniref:Uncharacterized protein n=1 Tax=Sorangium cellulosum TaxID=56 RepID=A0A150SMA1_SORCE|nr:hypothetical protein BE17_37160 [Sorangium cellulosum]
MQSQLRSLGMLVSGGVIVASNVLAYLSAPRGSHFGLVDLLHVSLPLALYCFANFCMDEGRARERAARGVREEEEE